MIKKFFIYLLFILLFINTAYAKTINKIEVTGNDRISKKTIILFSGFKEGEKIDDYKLNQIVKELYKTEFFSDVKVKINNNTLLISIIENPVIQKIKINGIKNKSILQVLEDNLVLKEKSSYNKSKLRSDKQNVVNILRSNGFYFSEVSTKIKEGDNNTITLIYDVDLGKRAFIQKIKFIGDKKIKDRKLKSVIVSEEAKFWKFISKKKYLDLQRVELDKKLLKSYYKNRGYYNVKISSSSAKIIDDKDFELIFNINAGNKYYFHDLNLTTPVDYSVDNFKDILEVLDALKGQPYSYRRVEDILGEIDKIALNKEFQFVSAKYKEQTIDNNKINLHITLEETEKSYIERLNISGNYITEENVIRNSLLVDEGDAYNDILLTKSINNIKSRNIFNKVTQSSKAGSEPNKKIIDISVEEKPTGEISAGAGTGTSGSTIAFGVRENNYIGRGVQLNANIAFSSTGLKGEFSSSNPNYKNSDKALNTSISRTERDLMSSSGFKNSKTGFSLGTSYEQFKDIYFSPSFSNSYESLETNSKASAAKRKQDGDYFESMFSYGLTLNRLNQNFQPTDGYKSSFYQTIPVYSDDLSFINSYEYKKYHSFDNDLVLSMSFFAKAVNSLSGEDVRVTKRVYIPERKLRGFQTGKIGPKDSDDYIGGNYGSALNFTSTLPALFPDLQNVDFNLFLDTANLWGVDYNSSLDSSKIRSSTGLAVDWFTPIGPLSFSFAKAITKADSDKIQFFRFSIGTTF